MTDPSGQGVLARPLHELPDPLPVPALSLLRGRPPFNSRLRTPGSKSLANRAILLAALCRGESIIRGCPRDADDTARMSAAVAALGASVATNADGSMTISGVDGRWRPSAPDLRLDLGNAGTATRFLAAASVLSPSPLVIDGNERMRQRPIAQLIDLLAQLGVRGEYGGAAGKPPVRLIPADQPPRAASLQVATTQSSQFISGLLLIAPWLHGGLTMRLTGEITSRSYIQMTLGLLDLLGAPVRTSDDLHIIRVTGAGAGGLDAFEYTVEPDASSAGYFWAAAAISPGSTCRVEGLDARSLQGDARFPDVLARMGATVIREEPACIGVRGPGALAPIMADLSEMPDAAMTLAAVACFASGRSVLRGLRTLRIKESDRISALQTELAKVGVVVETNLLGDADVITITPPAGGIACGREAPRVEFDTYDDHRMAMSLSLIGLRRPNTFVRNPACVAKTYPGFWAALGAAVLD